MIYDSTPTLALRIGCTVLCGEFIRRPASVTRVVLAARGAVYHITHDLHCKATRDYIQICGHHAKLTRARYYLF